MSTYRSFKVGTRNVIISIGDFVCATRIGTGSVKEFVQTSKNESVRVGDSVVHWTEIRFVNNSPENAVNNALLEEAELSRNLERAKEDRKALDALYRKHTRRQKKLSSQGLCKQAITAQLKAEFPELYMD